LAVLLVCATFPLIWIGGLVTSSGAGMAFPSWLTIDGRFFLLYPLERWLGGAWDQFIEHGHRLYASAVGLLTILLSVSLWGHDDRTWARWCGLGAIAGVCLQGLLGGLRVNLNQQALAMIHGCVGPLFFCLCVAIAAFTSRWWRDAPLIPTLSPKGRGGNSKLLRFAVFTAGLSYVQLVLGAWLRHLAAGSSGKAFHIAVMFHLLLAAAVLGHALYLAHLVFWRRREALLLWPAIGLAVLVLLQVALGAGTWLNKYGWPGGLAQFDFAQRFLVVRGGPAQIWITTAHVAFGSLILGTSLLLGLRVLRTSGVAEQARATRQQSSALGREVLA
jgi:cytochrome c oxidase assembly protein subunit 15